MPATERFLRDAGIAPGMRVLDIGCGMGDVTMLVAQLVGPTGRIVPVDLDQASLDTARKRAAAIGLDNTTFHQSDISTITGVGQFDAIVGRLVLEFLPDPVGVIRRLCGLLRPGGIMALQEPSWKVWLDHTSHLPLRSAVVASRRLFGGRGDYRNGVAALSGVHGGDLTPPTCALNSPLAILRNFAVCPMTCFWPCTRTRRRPGCRSTTRAIRLRWRRVWKTS